MEKFAIVLQGKSVPDPRKSAEWYVVVQKFWFLNWTFDLVLLLFLLSRKSISNYKSMDIQVESFTFPVWVVRKNHYQLQYNESFATPSDSIYK